MDEKELKRSGSRSGIGAAVAVVFLGIILICGAIIIFSAINCNTVTDKISAGSIAEAFSEYDSMNPAGRLVFGKKIEKSFLKKYGEYLDKGYITTAREMTKTLEDNLEGFRFEDYSSKLASCASKALWNGDYKAAADAADYILEKQPKADISVLRSGLEAQIESFASESNFDAVGYIVKRLPGADLERLVSGMALAAYNTVFGGSEPDFSKSARLKLEKLRDISILYSLENVRGGDVLSRYLSHYISACGQFEGYFEVYKLYKTVSSDLELAQRNFRLALNAETEEECRSCAGVAYNYASRAYENSQNYDSSQLGVTEYKDLCYKIARNTFALSAFKSDGDIIACREKQVSLEKDRARYDAEITENVDGFSQYEDAKLNLSLQALYS
ncbi:MAG: hypothetical protein IK085_00640 [Clostridia bacterium]|nr:hypothetical protein [Clostridia bacterium]